MVLELILGILVVLVILIALVIIVIFNGLVSKRNRVQDAWAQIDVQLKRRYDLIPNLIETVKGYMKYEKGVLTQVTALRSSIVSGSIQDKAAGKQQAQLSSQDDLRRRGELSGPEGVIEFQQPPERAREH